MATMTMRLDDADTQLVRKYADFEGKDVSDLIRDTAFGWIEDREDLTTLRKALAENDGVRYSHAEVLKELGL